MVLEEGHICREIDMLIYMKKTLGKRMKEKHAGVYSGTHYGGSWQLKQGHMVKEPKKPLNVPI